MSATFPAEAPPTPGPAFGGDRNDVSSRLEALAAAVVAARGRIDDEALDRPPSSPSAPSERLRLSGEHTIVALAGATGSGKSSLFNALTDLELAGVGVRRPTTSWALACAWGPDGAQGLLEWMGIPARHQVSRLSMLDRSAEDQKLDGLVLLDLPDHDSTEVDHHLEMDRLVKYADVLVWVLDPQKYADAAIHDRYIRPMASFKDVTVVVLNQIDRIPYEQRDRALTDVRRILDEEGLQGVTVIGASATRGDGIEELKRELAQRIRAKASAKGRLISDITGVGDASRGGRRHQSGPGHRAGRPEALDLALLDCVGVPAAGRGHRGVHPAPGSPADRMAGHPLARAPQRPASGAGHRSRTGPSPGSPARPRCPARRTSSGPRPRPPCVTSPRRRRSACRCRGATPCAASPRPGPTTSSSRSTGPSSGPTSTSPGRPSGGGSSTWSSGWRSPHSSSGSAGPACSWLANNTT